VARGGRGGDGVVAPSGQPQRQQQAGQRRARGGAASVVEEVIVEDDDWKVDSRGTPGAGTSIRSPSIPRAAGSSSIGQRCGAFSSPDFSCVHRCWALTHVLSHHRRRGGEAPPGAARRGGCRHRRPAQRRQVIASRGIDPRPAGGTVHGCARGLMPSRSLLSCLLNEVPNDSRAVGLLAMGVYVRLRMVTCTCT